jgi:hypothetical protein
MFLSSSSGGLLCLALPMASVLAVGSGRGLNKSEVLGHRDHQPLVDLAPAVTPTSTRRPRWDQRNSIVPPSSTVGLPRGRSPAPPGSGARSAQPPGAHPDTAAGACRRRWGSGRRRCPGCRRRRGRGSRAGPGTRPTGTGGTVRPGRWMAPHTVAAAARPAPGWAAVWGRARRTRAGRRPAGSGFGSWRWSGRGRRRRPPARRLAAVPGHSQRRPPEWPPDSR